MHIKLRFGSFSMSSGGFQTARYLSDAGQVHRIKVQPETLELTLGGASNSSNPNDVDSAFSARVSGSRRGYGLYSRTVTIEFLEGDAPAGYEDEGKITLPWLDGSSFSSLLPGTVGQYLGSTVTLVGKRPEVSR